MQILAKRLTRIICLRFHEAGFKNKGIISGIPVFVIHRTERPAMNVLKSVIVKVFYLFDTGNNSLCKMKHAS